MENKSTSCVECGYVFDEFRKYHSRDRCNPCYQKSYLRDRLGQKKTKELSTTCSICNAEYGTINAKGRPVVRGPKNCCKSCYSKSKKPKKECEQCGNEMLAGSNTGLCVVCREVKRLENGKRPWKRKPKPLPLIDIDSYENIRRILVRFKYRNNGILDNFRVVDAYMDLCENPVFLDTLTEEAQVIEMLRYLKKVYDFNKEDMKEKEELVKKKAESKAKYYKYQKKEKKVNLTADMKAYRREYYRKHYASNIREVKN